MHTLPPLISDLALMLCVAGIVTLLFQRIRQPVVLGYLVAGIIIGPYTPPHSLLSDAPNIKTLSELGVIFLMFSLGLEFSFHKLMKVGFSASITGLLEVVCMTLIGFGAGHMLGWSFNNCLFLGAALAISSTTIIIKAIDELGLSKKRFAELIFGVLVVEDLLAVLLLVALSTVVTTNNIWSPEIMWAAGKLVLVVGGWFIAGYFLIPTLLRRMMQYTSDETLTVVSIGLCLFLVWVAVYFHYSAALGAFIMGSILAETPLIHRIELLVKPIRDVFAAVFFISIGMLIDPQIIIQHWPLVLFLTAVTIVGKLLTTGLSSLLTGQSLETSLRVGFSMAQVGEFSFIIIGLGFLLHAINDLLYPIIVAIAGITTFTTPYFIRYSEPLAKKIDAKLTPRTKYMMERYATTLYQLQSSSGKTSLFRKNILCLLANGILIAIIFKLTDRFVLPEIQLFFNAWLADIVGWLSTIVLCSPFLWGMLFSFKALQRQDRKSYFSIGTLMIWVITLIEVTLLSVTYFQTWSITLSFIIVAAVLFGLMYKQLGKTYHWFEKRLINNIKKLDVRNPRYEELAPWDTHLVETSVSQLSPIAHKTLQENQIRQLYGINIVAIYRGVKAILAPIGTEQILPFDRLIILGNDEQIELFRRAVEIDEPMVDPVDVLNNFSLKAILIEKNNPLIGKTIRESKIREAVYGLIVGLEHQGQRILNPDPATILQQGDLLLIVGKTEYLNVYMEASTDCLTTS